jgi:RNA polymerase sigma-54 factor
MKQTQQLVMTPQLQQAIRLLQLSRLELAEMVQQEILENPVLDETAPPDSEGDVSLDQPELLAEEPTPVSSDREEEVDVLSIPKDLKEWQSYLESGQNLPYHVKEDQDRPPFEALISKPDTLHEHLLWQLRMTRLSDEEYEVGREIIGNLDDNGYLKGELEEILLPMGEDAARLGPEILNAIQKLDPPGVGARSLEECLLIQIEQAGHKSSLMEAIIREHLDSLSRGNTDKIIQETGASRVAVMECLDLIRELEPKPGRPFGGSESVYVTPDVFIYKMGDEWVISLNDDGMPKLRINSFYRDLLSRGESMGAEDKEFLLDKLRSAAWLIKSIDQRQRTIYKVSKSILEKQSDFFERGVRFLKPMVLRDVADDVGVHESTVSRVTTQKYLNCPQGMFELKFFFNPGIQTLSGEMLASESVRVKIKDIIKAEDSSRPLSDQAISEMLRLEGIDIARRTVAKYREAMNIMPSSRRKTPV